MFNTIEEVIADIHDGKIIVVVVNDLHGAFVAQDIVEIIAKNKRDRVAVRSFITCSKAAWVLGGARLISSASRIWLKTGPLVRTNSLVWKL